MIGNTLHSRMEVAGVDAPARVVADEDHTAGGAPLYLEPIAWTDEGIVVADQPGNIGGFPLFFDDDYWWTTRLLDPRTLATRPLSTGQACPFNDLAKDGSFMCLARQAGGVEVHRADGGVRRLTLPAPVVTAGDALFSTDGTRLAVGVSHSDDTGGAQQVWDVGAYVIELGDGSATRTGPGGTVPAGWLPDGFLVLEDVVHPNPGTANSAAILGADGRLTSLGPGAYLGALDPEHALAAHTPVG